MAHDDIPSADPFAELKSTGALMLLIAAVIGGVLGAAEWGSGSGVAATSICTAAAVGFALSVARFVKEGRPVPEARQTVGELPFPSWLRNEADAA